MMKAQGLLLCAVLALATANTAFGQPSLANGAAVNAAHFRPQAIPGGAIAQGSIYSLFGSNLGSTEGVSLQFPLTAELAGISIEVTQGATTVASIPLFSNGNQINAIMPSDAPLGEVEITVTVNGMSSNAITAEVVTRSLGIFTVSSAGFGPGILQNFESEAVQPINSLRQTARQGQVMILWGTGLGAIAAPDSEAPPFGDLTRELEITVGGVSAETIRYAGRSGCCAGVDQIVFDIPAGAPSGCYVPVLVRTTDNDVVSNAVTIAIDEQGSACQDEVNAAVSGLFDDPAVPAPGLATVNLSQSKISLMLGPGQVIDAITERGIADFETVNPWFFDHILALPPPGACTIYYWTGQLLLGVDIQDVLNAPARQGLDAGAVTVTRQSDAAMRQLGAATPGRHYASLGGGLPLPGMPPPEPTFVQPDVYTVTGAGGAAGANQVGPFTASIEILEPPVWTNAAQIQLVPRGQPVTFQWSGGDPQTQAVFATILSINSDDSVAAGVFCAAAIEDGELTLPGSLTATLPASTFDDLGLPDGLAGVLIAPKTASTTQFFADGLSRGVLSYSLGLGQPVVVQ